MIESTIARRYAKALVDIAKETKELDSYLSQVEAFNGALRVSAQLKEILSNRFLDLGSRLKIVDELGGKLNLTPLVVNFIKLLIKKGRITIYPLIALSFHDYVLELQNKVEAFVTSAVLLEPSFYQTIQDIFSKKMNREIIINKDIRPEVLGGIRVRIGNEVYDGTIRAEFEKLSEQMRKTVFM